MSYFEPTTFQTIHAGVRFEVYDKERVEVHGCIACDSVGHLTKSLSRKPFRLATSYGRQDRARAV